MKKRSRPTEIPDDPTVAEVRRWRARLVKDAGGTLQGLISYLNARASKRRAGSTAARARRSRKGRAA